MAGAQSFVKKDITQMYRVSEEELLKQADYFILNSQFNVKNQFNENIFLHNFLNLIIMNSNDCYVNKAIKKRCNYLRPNYLESSCSYNVEIINQICLTNEAPDTPSEW
jgi:hypothetical protein